MNIKPQFSRTAMLLGGDAVERLGSARVAVFGLGGVGGALCEALARAGVGELTLIDGDTVSVTNINRQIIATHSTVGMPKTEAMRARILDINPDCRVDIHTVFYSADNADMIDYSDYDYVADAIDTVTSKLLIVVRANEAGVPVISAFSPRAAAHSGKVVAIFFAKGLQSLLARPGVRSLSWQRTGMRFIHAPNTTGTATKPPLEKHTSGLILPMSAADWNIPASTQKGSVKFCQEK